MPFYEYNGLTYDIDTTDLSVAKNKILAHLGKPAQSENTSLSEDIKIGWGNVGKTIQDYANVGVSGLMGLLEDPNNPDLSPERNLERFKNIQEAGEQTKKRIDAWANPEGKEQTFGGKVTSVLGSLPGQLATFPMSPAQTGKEFVDAGETKDKAVQAAFIDTAGNMVGALLPGAVGTTIAGKVASGAAINAAQDAVTKQVISSMADTEKAKEMFAPTLESTALAGIVGGGIGGVHGVATREPKLPEPKPTQEGEDTAPTVPQFGEKELVQNRLQEAQRQKDYAEYQISELEKALNDPKNAKRTPEEAEAFKNEILAAVEEHQRDIESSNRTIEKATSILNGEEEKVQTENVSNEFPSSTPPRPQGEEFVLPEEKPEAQPEVIQPAKEETVSETIPKIEEENTKFQTENKLDFLESQHSRTEETIASLTRKLEESLKVEKEIGDYNDSPAVRISNELADNEYPSDSKLDELISKEKERLIAGGLDSKWAHATATNNVLESLKGLPYRELPVDHVPSKQIQDSIASQQKALKKIREEYLDKLNETIEFLKDGTLPERYKGELRDLFEKRSAIENLEQIEKDKVSFVGPERPGPIFIGATKEEEAGIRSILESVGLDKEKIDFNLSAEHLYDEQTRGTAYASGDVGKVDVVNTDYFKSLINSSPAAAEYAKTLTDPESSARFAKMFTVAHEIGHQLLFKLVQTTIYSKELDGLVKAYDAWKATVGPDTVRIYSGVHRKLDDIDAEYYAQFPEFFAQRVAKVLLIGDRAPLDGISKFVRDVKKMWNDLRALFQISVKANMFVDDFIIKIIDDNKKSLEETGKNIWEIASTKMSLEDSWYHHNAIFNYKSFYGLEGKAGHTLEKDFGFGTRRLQAITTIKDSKEAVERQLSIGKDINPLGTGTIWKDIGSVFLKGVNNLFGIQQLKGIYSTSPAISYAIDTIIKSLNKQSERQMELLSGKADYSAWTNKNKPFWTSLKRMKEEDSPTVVFEKSSDEDFHAVHQVFEKGIGSYSYEESLAKFGGSLTPQQKVLFNTLSKMYAKMYKMAEGLEGELGKKKIIPNVKGWFPSVRKGEFSVSIHRKGIEIIAEKLPDGTRVTTNAVYSQSFRTRKEAEDFIAHFNAQPNNVKGKLYLSNIIESGKTELPNTLVDFAKLYHETVESAKRQGIETDEAVQNLIDSYIARGGALGKHHKLRTNLPGSKGSEMFRSTQELGKSFKAAQFDAVKEYTSLMKKMEIGTKIDLMLEDQRLKESQPNVHEALQSIRDYSLNNIESPLEMKGMKRFLDNIWIDSFKGESKVRKVFGMKKYQDAYISDVAAGKLNHFFYLHVLMGRPAFWVGQSTQFLWAARSLVKDGSGPVDAVAAFGKGIKQLSAPSEDFLKAVFWASQNTHVFSPQFIHDLSKFHIADFLHEDSKAKLFFELITGEKQSTMADTFSRLITFASVHEHLKGKGMSGEDLWRKTIEITDENMVQYGRDYKSPVFQKMGVFGDLLSPLATFATASTGNLTADLLQIARTPVGRGKLKATLPFIMTAAITTLIAGAIGAPLIAEYELFRLFLNALADKLGMEARLPSVVDLVLSGDNTFSNRVLSHGLLSASTMAIDKEGFDIGSSNRWQPVFQGILEGEKSFLEFLPSINFAFQMTGNVNTILGHSFGYKDVSDAELRQAKMGVTPGGYKAIVDDVVFNAANRKFEPTAKGDAFLPQTTAKRVAKYLGTSTVEASTERLRNRRFTEMKLRDQQKVNKLKEILVDSVVKQDKEKIKEVATELATKYGMSADQINNFIEAEMFRRNVPQGTRRFAGKNATSTQQQENAYQKWMDTYGDSPFRNED